MFTLEDLRQTRVFQEALQEGHQQGWQEGRREGEAQLLLRQLEGRFGPPNDRLKQQIQALTIEQLETLGVHLWDCRAIADVETWLQKNGV